MLEAVKVQIESSEGVRRKDCKSLVIYAFIISRSCGCEWGLSCMRPLPVSSPCVRGTGPVPGAPKFGISIQRGNGHPFAACHPQDRWQRSRRSPSSRAGSGLPVVLHDPPLILTVHFLPPLLGRSPSHYLICSLPFKRNNIKKRKEHNHICI